MKYTPLIGMFLTVCSCLNAQPVKTVYRTTGDSTQNFYIIRTPSSPPRGLLVLNARTLSDTANMIANYSGVCIVTIVPTANNLDNLTSISLLNTIDEIIGEVIKTTGISNRKVIIGGMSAAGTGSIRYAEYCSSGKSKSGIKPTGVFGVDSPLDYERLYNESDRAIIRNFSNDAVDESKMLIKLLKTDLKGTPKTNLRSYHMRSPFCYSAINGGNAHLLTNLAVRIYTEPDINWWIDNRRKDYYDLNSIDDAALIDQLRINGNVHAELIVSDGKGLKLAGHPHSWDIVDEKELLLWCSELFEK